MTNELTIGVRDLVALLIGLGGPGAVYVAMRERMVKHEGKIETLTEVIKELRDTIKGHDVSRASQGEDIGEVREELAGLRVRVEGLEKWRSGSMPAVRGSGSGPIGGE